MLYIGFSNYSNKFYAKIFCKKYKHCAPIVVNKNNATIYQFVHMKKTLKIVIKKSDLRLLKQHGWVFIKYSTKLQEKSAIPCLTCVQFTKQACGIKNIKIQTPQALLNHLSKK